MSKRPLEFISLSSLKEHEDLVISQIPDEARPPEEDEELYAIRIWRKGYGEFIDTIRWKERFKMILNIFFTGRVSSNDLILSKSQLVKLSSWIYIHDNHPEDDEEFIPA